MPVMKLVFAIIIIILSGHILLFFINKKQELGISPAPWFALSFIFGLGLLSLQMFFYSLVGIGFSVSVIALPWIFISLFQYLYFRGKRSSSLRCSDGGVKFFGCLASLKGFGFLEWLALLVITSQVLYAFFAALLMPISGWDAWAIWFMKARIFFLEGKVASAFLLNKSYASTHLDYPLLVPLAVSWIYTCLGTVNDQLAKVIFPLLFSAMLIVFFYIVRRLSTRGNAILFTALLALSPVIMTHTGGFSMPFGSLYSGDFVGYADLMLSIYFFSAAAFFYLYMLKDDTWPLFCSVLFLALGAWTKNEGLPYAFFGVILIALYLLISPRIKRPGAVFIALLVLSFLVIAAPWLFYKSYLNLQSEYMVTLSLSTVMNNIGRLPLILSRTGGFMFRNVELFNLTWYLYFLTLILNWRRFFSAPLAFLNLFFFLQFSLYIFIYIISPNEINWHLDTSLDRLLLHMVPLVTFITAINFYMLLGRQKPDISA